MSESSRSDSAPAQDAASGSDRDAKIEQLLLVGLDHYFATQYQEAINVWTRALFLDRSHPRARAYIERARSALAERQRQSEELLHHGVDAFHRGEGDEARRLLQAAIDGGAPSDEAFAVLERLNRFDSPSGASLAGPSTAPRRDRVRLPRVPVDAPVRESMGRAALLAAIVVAVVAAGGYAAVSTNVIDWPGWLPFEPPLTRPAAAAAPPVARETTLAVPRRGEIALSRARQLAGNGRLREALATLDGVRPTDPQRADADRLRADIQRQMLALTPPTAADKTDPGRR
ncbi:MAG TPA: hypothetical protein VGY57_12280 [Vicinamibacterales bacterium]|nr:hypothetical protein [Vicinamibacterales bacterium]